MSCNRGITIGVSICIRCQLRLNRQQCKRAYNPLRRKIWNHAQSQRAFTSTPARLLPQLDWTRDNVEDDDTVNGSRGNGDHDFSEGDIGGSEFTPRPSVRPRSSREQLGVKALGEPARALVLEALDDTHFRPGSVQGVTDPGRIPAPGSSSDAGEIVDELRKEQGFADDKRARSNLDAAGKTFAEQAGGAGSLLDETSYNEMRDALVRGFQKSQLIEYIERASSIHNDDPLNMVMPYKGKEMSRTAWAELDADKGSRFTNIPTSSVRYHYDPFLNVKKMKKSEMATTIMTCIWGIHSEAISHAMGDFMVQIPEAHLSLLRRHPDNIIQGVAKANRATIETYELDGMLKIKASLSNSGQIMETLWEYISNITSASLATPTDQILPNSYSEPVDYDYIKEMSRYTNTVIRPSTAEAARRTIKDAAKIQVYYFGPETTDLENARRLAKSASEPLALQGIMTSSCVIDSRLGVEITALPINITNGLPLPIRHRHWSRLAKARGLRVAHEKPTMKKDGELLPGGLFRDRLVRRALFTQPPTIDTSGFVSSVRPCWQTATNREISATIGHVAVESSVANELVKEGQPELDALEDKLRGHSAFTSSVPGLNRSLEIFDLVPEPFVDNKSSNSPSQSLSITLIPEYTPQSPRLDVRKLPILKLDVRFDTDQDIAVLVDARFVVHTFEVNAMLPAQLFDVQYRNVTYLKCEPSNIDPKISDFVKDSNLNPTGSERLSTPQDLEIQIPPNAFASSELLKYFASVSADFAVRYRFAKLEHCSTMYLRTNSRQRHPGLATIDEQFLKHTTIEAGAFEGRREELTILNLPESPEAGAQSLDSLVELDSLVKDGIDGEEKVRNGRGNSAQGSYEAEVRGDEAGTVEVSAADRETPTTKSWNRLAEQLGTRGRAKRLVNSAVTAIRQIENASIRGRKLE